MKLDSLPMAEPVDAAAFRAQETRLREALMSLQFDVLEREKFAVHIVLFGLDPLARSEVARRLMEWLDTRHLQPLAFQRPPDGSRERPRFWRFWTRLAPRGRTGLYLTSWYDRPLRDHIAEDGSLDVLSDAAEEINRFERLLLADGATLLKLVLWEPRDRIEKAVERRIGKRGRPAPWRMSPEERDVGRALLDDFDHAHDGLEALLALTGHAEAPWIPVASADDRARDLLVGQALCRAVEQRLQRQSPAMPAPGPVEVAAPAVPGPHILSTIDLDQRLDDEVYRATLKEEQARLTRLTTSRAFEKRGLVLAFEGHDAAGKGGAIRRLVHALDPRMIRLVPVSAPSDEERAQPWLWRFWRHLPEQGDITIYDRSWYGRVLVERVEGFAAPDDWQRAYGEIRDFERQLSEHGLIVHKFWLAIDKDEQLARFRAREITAHKRHKITDEDWRNREKWDAYRAALHDMIVRTDTRHAPWTVIPSNDKRFARVEVLKRLNAALENALDGD